MRVVVASGSPLLRAILTETLSATDDVRTVESVDSVAGLLAAVGSGAPQVVLASPTLVDGKLSHSVTKLLRANARVLVICDASDSAEASATLFAGATGCLLVQDAGAEDVIAAVREVAAGRASLHPTVAASVLSQWRGSRSTTAPTPTERSINLTTREHEVLDALARGLPTKSIGRELGVSPKTIETHIGRLLAKLDARTRAQALAVAMDRGLLVPGGADAALA